MAGQTLQKRQGTRIRDGDTFEMRLTMVSCGLRSSRKSAYAEGHTKAANGWGC